MYGDYEDKEYFRELAAKAGVEDLPWVKNAINSTLFLQKPKNRQRLLRFLSIKIQQNVKEDHPFLAAPTKKQISQGDYELCRVVTGRGPEYPAKVDKNIAPEHGIIVGPSGSGKTTWLVRTAQEIHRTGLNPETGERETAVWLFDTEGQIPYFMSVAGAVGCEDVLIIDVLRMFKFNRYFPPGVPDKVRYLTKVTVQDRECRYFRDFTMSMVRDACFELLNRQRVFNERQLLEHIASKKFKPGTRSGNSKESILNRFRDSLEYMGSIYDTQRSHDLAALTKRTVVWMLGGLSSDHKATFIGDLTLWLKECLPVSYSPSLKLVLIIDEFADFCNIQRLKRADLQEPYLLDVARVFRKRSASLIYGTQSVYTVPYVILSNISCFWIVFRPSEGFSKRLLAQNLSLDDPEQARYMMLMPDRYVVCRTKNCPKTFLGHVGEITLPVATDQEVAERLEQTQHVLDSLLEPEPDQPSLFSITPTDEQSETLYGYYDLTKECLDYLEFLAQHPFMTIGELDRIDSLSDYKANAIRQRLIDTGPGLILIHRITTGKKGGPVSTIDFPNHTLHMLDRLQIKYPEPIGHGSIDHKFWQHNAFRFFTEVKGYQAQIEKWISGKSADLSVEWSEKKVAVEIALENMEKEINNLIRNFEAGWDQVIFCVLTDKELNCLKNEIAARFGSKVLEGGKVAFMKLSTFLPTKKKKPKALS